MKLFITHASEDSAAAEEIYLALLGAGHDVFFDKPVITSGENFVSHIAHKIKDSDGLVFLISPDSVASGRYTLTELRSAREKWPHPEKRVLPVKIRSVEYESIPSYLRAVTILEPEGNVAAEVVAAINKWNPRAKQIDLDAATVRWPVFVLVVAILAIGLGTMFSIVYPRVSVNFNIVFLIVLVSTTIVLVFRSVWRKIIRREQQ